MYHIIHRSSLRTKEVKKYWYKFTCYYCPVCGRGEDEWEKERIYTPKPENGWERYEATQYYDYCDSL